MDGLLSINVTVKAAATVAECWKKAPHTVGFVNGCFDLLHYGHIYLLREAKSKCDRLVVGLNTDASVRKLKGYTRPIVPYDHRYQVVGAIRYVDYVFGFNGTNCASEIIELKPHFWIKGGDYSIKTIDQEELKAARAVGARIHFLPFIGKYSSTEIMSAYQSRVMEPNGVG